MRASSLATKSGTTPLGLILVMSTRPVPSVGMKLWPVRLKVTPENQLECTCTCTMNMTLWMIIQFLGHRYLIVVQRSSCSQTPNPSYVLCKKGKESGHFQQITCIILYIRTCIILCLWISLCIHVHLLPERVGKYMNMCIQASHR